MIISSSETTMRSRKTRIDRAPRPKSGTTMTHDITPYSRTTHDGLAGLDSHRRAHRAMGGAQLRYCGPVCSLRPELLCIVTIARSGPRQMVVHGLLKILPDDISRW